VREKGVATAVTAYHPTFKCDGSFIILGMPQSGISLDSLEAEILHEIERLKYEPVSEKELNKAKNQALAQSIYERDSPARIGLSIGWWEIESGSWENMNRYPEEIQKVTADDIMAVAQQYFTHNNRTVGYLLPREEE
jgi:zinc protease